MNPQFLPLTLGDIFEKTFSLFGKTFVRNLIIALIFLMVPIVVMVIAADAFYSSIADMQESLAQGQAENGLDVLFSIAGTLSFFGFAAILLIVFTMFAEIAISIIVSQEMLSRTISFSDAINETFSQKWIYGIGQGLDAEGIIKIFDFNRWSGYCRNTGSNVRSIFKISDGLSNDTLHAWTCSGFLISHIQMVFFADSCGSR